MTDLTTHPVSKLSGTYIPPGDKSISHRLAMLGALARGTSTFNHFLDAEDCLRTVEAFRKMGVISELRAEKTTGGMTAKQLVVQGVGLRGLKAPRDTLDLGNSGTTMRLLLGVLAGQSFEARITGDASLVKRPMGRVVEPLRKMGAQISGADDGNFAPLVIQGGPLKCIEWQNEIGSAQVKSAILIAGLFTDGVTTIREPRPTRDHMERLLPLFGAPVDVSQWKTLIRHADTLNAISFDVPGDFSSASFFIAAALIIPGSDIRITNVGLNPTRIGLYRLLKLMGAQIEIERIEDTGEPVGDLRVRASKLKGAEVTAKEVPTIIDELPILMVVAALSEGKTVIRGAGELRVKETDRLASMSEGLKAIGAKVDVRQDGCVIEGVGEFVGGTVKSYGDHRTAMSFAIAGLRAKGEVKVTDADCISISYPNFCTDLQTLSS